MNWRRAASPVWVRLTALSVAVLGLALATSVLIAWRLAAVQGGDELDAQLQRERDLFAATAPTLLTGVTAADSDGLARRFEGYLFTAPGTDRHLTAISVDGSATLRTAAGPAAVLALLDEGALPEGTPGRLRTVATGQGRLRILAAPIEVQGQRVGTLTVYGYLGAVDAQAALVARVGTLAAVGAGLAGAVTLALAFRSATAPLRSLHEVADLAGVADLTVRVPEPDGRVDEVADLARAFNRMLGRLEGEVGARTALFAAVSHELRTPVAVARGHVELLESGSAKDREASLRLVREELGRLSRLLDDLFLLAARDGGALIAVRPVQREWLADQLALRLAGLGLTDVPVEIDADCDPGGRVLIDPDRVVQAVINLAVNARVHTPPGTRATVVVGGVEDGLSVTVTDHGPGIAPELRERVLEPFVGRGGRGSTGLGLAVVKAVADAHGGTLDLDTGPGGTEVRMSLPGRPS